MKSNHKIKLLKKIKGQYSINIANKNLLKSFERQRSLSFLKF